MFFILGSGLVLLLSSANYSLKRFSIPIIIISFFLSLLITFISKKSYEKAFDKMTAVVMSPSVTVMSTPHSEGTKLFTIHEGLTVIINSVVDGWYEIRLEDGRVGWLNEVDIELV
jgi:disulfide bond formation protein DsbB